MRKLSKKQQAKLVAELENIIKTSTTWYYNGEGEEEVIDPDSGAQNIFNYLVDNKIIILKPTPECKTLK